MYCSFFRTSVIFITTCLVVKENITTNLTACLRVFQNILIGVSISNSTVLIVRENPSPVVGHKKWLTQTNQTNVMQFFCGIVPYKLGKTISKFPYWSSWANYTGYAFAKPCKKVARRTKNLYTTTKQQLLKQHSLDVVVCKLKMQL